MSVDSLRPLPYAGAMFAAVNVLLFAVWFKIQLPQETGVVGIRERHRGVGESHSDEYRGIGVWMCGNVSC